MQYSVNGFKQDKAYGDNPPDDSIPKGATLIFDIELLKIDGKGKI